MLNLKPVVASDYAPAVPRLNLCFFNKKLRRISSPRTKIKSCQATMTCSVQSARRSTDYHPTVWDHRHIQLIRSPYNGGEQFNKRIDELKREVKKLFRETEGGLANLELIDSIQQLGIGYHFEEEIGDALARLSLDGLENLSDLNETALCFRLLRQRGHHVPSDVFDKFRDGEEFKNSLSQDVKGLLNLYEATHLSLPGEQILDQAKSFSVKHLRRLSEDTDLNLAEQVKHSLEVPSYWLMPRVKARHYIDLYDKEKGRNSSLLELAKLDFNVVQALHQKEIRELSTWWEELGLFGEASFGRDRIFESYFWAIGIAFEPQFSMCRKAITKLISIVNVIDDFYDTYGTLEEAELFTVAIRRWDLKAMDGLPDYLKLCYMAWYNFVNVTAHDVFKRTGMNVRHLLERESIRLCEAYLKEARWFHQRMTPSLEEYLENGWTSVGNPILIFHALYFVGHGLSEESIDHMEQAHQLVHLSSLLVRLIDDLAPSKAEEENGETSLSIHCHMKDSGASYETSKEFIKELIDSYWKELNKETLNNNLPQVFVYVLINSVRSCFTMFQHGDGFGTSTGVVKDQITSLFVEPIPMEF